MKLWDDVNRLMGPLDELSWRDRFVLRFHLPPSQRFIEFIEFELKLAVEKHLAENRLPPPLPK
jgi:hypothetical protein